MPDLKPEIEKIFAKYEKDFMLDRGVAERVGGEEGVRLVEDLKKQFWLMRVHLIESRDSVDEDEVEELKELIANKLALGSKTAGDDDWWWTPAEPHVADFLKKVQRTLEKATEGRSKTWRRWFSYAWTVFVEVVYLAVVIAIFYVAKTKFETAVLAVLVMIYNAAVSVRVGVGVSLAYLGSLLQNAYGEIGRSLRLRIPVFHEREAEKQVNEVAVEMLIHGISVGIGNLIALWKIVTTLLQ